MIVLNSQPRRRSKRQIEEDEASARAEAVAIEEDAAAKRRAVLARIAQLEESAELEEDTRNRPDLRRNAEQEQRIILKLPIRRATHTAPPPDETVGEGGDDYDSASDFIAPPSSTAPNEWSPRGSPDLVDWEDDDDTSPTLDRDKLEDCRDEMPIDAPSHGVMQRGHKKKPGVCLPSHCVVTKYLLSAHRKRQREAH
jgi:hypothetical protein